MFDIYYNKLKTYTYQFYFIYLQDIWLRWNQRFREEQQNGMIQGLDWLELIDCQNTRSRCQQKVKQEYKFDH